MINVYIVEDSKLVQFALSELLAVIGGFRVVGTASGETQATEWLLQNPEQWDLVTLDLTLKEGSGFNLIRRFRQANPTGKVIVLSDFATPGVRTRCLHLGADACFGKSEGDGLTQYLACVARPT